jgi:hypothetical protein
MSQQRSGSQRGQDNVAAFETYLDGLRERGESLPLTPKGDVNLSKVAAESGIRDRGRFYTNERLKSLLADASKTLVSAKAPVDAPAHESQPVPRDDGGDALRRAERRAQRLEQANAVLVAENADLRRQMRDLRLQMGRDDMVIETGRRVVPPKPE